MLIFTCPLNHAPPARPAHVVAWVLAEGRRPRARAPHHAAHIPAHPAPLSLGHQQELLDASVSEAEARSSPCWDHGPATCRDRLRPVCRVRAAPHAVAYPAPHLHAAARGGLRARAPAEAPSARGRGGRRASPARTAHAPRRPSPTALPPRPHVGTIFLPFCQAQLRVRVRVGLLLWRRAGPGDLCAHSALLRRAGAAPAHVQLCARRPRRPRSPLRLTPNS